MESSKKIALVLVGSALLLLAACNTMAGFGKDLSSAGGAITRTANSEGAPATPGNNHSDAVRRH